MNSERSTYVPSYNYKSKISVSLVPSFWSHRNKFNCLIITVSTLVSGPETETLDKKSKEVGSLSFEVLLILPLVQNNTLKPSLNFRSLHLVSLVSSRIFTECSNMVKGRP